MEAFVRVAAENRARGRGLDARTRGRTKQVCANGADVQLEATEQTKGKRKSENIKTPLQGKNVFKMMPSPAAGASTSTVAAAASVGRASRTRISMLPAGASPSALFAPVQSVQKAKSSTRRASLVSTPTAHSHKASRANTALAAVLVQPGPGMVTNKQKSTTHNGLRRRAAPRAKGVGRKERLMPSSAASLSAARKSSSSVATARVKPCSGTATASTELSAMVRVNSRSARSKRVPVARRCSRCGDFGHNSRSCPHEYFQSRLCGRSLESQHCAKCNGAGVVTCTVCHGHERLSMKSNPSKGVLASPTVQLVALSHLTYSYLGEGRSEICFRCGGSCLQVCPGCHGLA